MSHDYLWERYVEEEKSTLEIAHEVGCSANTVNARLRECDIGLKSQGEHNSRDITGEKFGSWTVLKKIGARRKTTIWLCRCECGSEREIHFGGLTSGQRSRCSDCGYRSQRSPEELTETIWGGIKRCATHRKIPFQIKKGDAYELFLSQKRQCALTGLPIGFAETMRGHNRGETTASLDRIDSLKGYVQGNIQWVHKDVNFIKQRFDEEYFKRICKLVVDHNL